MNQWNENLFVIDLKELFILLAKKVWIILGVGLLTALCAGLYSKLFITPMYTSTTSVYVINRQSEEITTLTDLQTSTQLTQDYKILVKSRSVIEQVISELNLKITYGQLVNLITVITPSDTRILEIIVNHSNPYMAKKLVDCIAKVSIQWMIQVMEIDNVNVIEAGNIPISPTSPNNKRNFAIGAISGILISAFIMVLIYLFNDTIKTSEDIEKYLGLSTLGTIPLEEKEGRKKNKKSKEKFIRRIKERLHNVRSNF